MDNSPQTDQNLIGTQPPRQILGKGSFGCVLAPKIPCEDINRRIKDKHEATASKLLLTSGINDENIEHFREKFEYEIKVATNLLKIDPNNIYFLGGDNFCAFKKSNLSNLDTKTDIDNCVKTPGNIPVDINEDNFVFNIEMKIAYPFLPLLDYLNLDHVIRVFAHLVRGIQILCEKTPYLFLDIKLENILIHTYQNKYFYPVFIDFSPTHVISNDYHHNFFHYVTNFDEFRFPLWPPEIKSSIILIRLLELLGNQIAHKSIEEISLFARYFSDELTKKNQIPYKITFNKIGKFVQNIQKNYFDYLPKNIKQHFDTYTDPKQAEIDVSDGLEYFMLPHIEKMYVGYTIDKNLREKIMLWQLAVSFLEILVNDKHPHTLRLIDILLKCASNNIQNRYSCDDLLRLLKRIFSHIFMPGKAGTHEEYMNQFNDKININVLNKSLRQ